MSINNEQELKGIQQAAQAVAYTLRKMVEYTKVGISTKELDDYGASILESMNANSAPNKTYNFPGYICISVNNEFCHGIPSENRVLQEAI